ncbi:MAG: hypothetical protein U9R42_11990 [Bacteroidota bacterium]|nr:hypothetical protein [Bacteroidota bacterium]
MNLQYISDNTGKPAGIFIPLKDWRLLIRKYKGLDNEVDNTESTKEEIFASIKQGLNEIQLIEQGKMKTTPLKDFLNDL